MQTKLSAHPATPSAALSTTYMPRHTAVRLDSPLAAEFLRGLDRVGSRFGVLLEGGDVWRLTCFPMGTA